MKKFYKRIFALVLVLGCCLQGVFAVHPEGCIDKDEEYEVTVNKPHKEYDENGDEYWVGTNIETGEKDFIPFIEDKDSEDYLDPEDPDSYTELGFIIPTGPEKRIKHIHICVDGGEVVFEEIIDEETVETDNYPEEYKGTDKECEDQQDDTTDTQSDNIDQDNEINEETSVTNQEGGAEPVVDPILSTSGQYVFSETDLSITIHDTTFNIGRFYNSQKEISDNLGKNWYFTLDTRVIRCYHSNMESEMTQVQINYDKVNEIYNSTLDVEKKIYRDFDEDKIRCEKRLGELRNQINQLETSEFREFLDEELALVYKAIETYENRIIKFKEHRDNELEKIKPVLAKQKEILDKYMLDAIVILCAILKKDLNIKQKELSINNLEIVDEDAVIDPRLPFLNY